MVAQTLHGSAKVTFSTVSHFSDIYENVHVWGQINLLSGKQSRVLLRHLGLRAIRVSPSLINPTLSPLHYSVSHTQIL